MEHKLLGEGKKKIVVCFLFFFLWSTDDIETDTCLQVLNF